MAIVCSFSPESLEVVERAIIWPPLVINHSPPLDSSRDTLAPCSPSAGRSTDASWPADPRMRGSGSGTRSERTIRWESLRRIEGPFQPHQPAPLGPHSSRTPR